MRILDSVLRRRGPAPAYRTIDGGHPAPYPDMTDEQLYNYELAFDVPRKTFDRPPPTARGGRYRGRIEPELAPVTNLYATQPQPSRAYGNDFNTAAARTAAPEWQQPPKTESMPYANTVTSAQEEEEPEQEEEMHTETATDAEDDNEATAWFAEANAWRAERNPRTSGDPRPLDFSKPVRTITTRQPVEIITTRARHPVYRVHGYIGEDEVVTVFTLDGQLSEHGPRFLENVPEQQELYLNIYPGLDGKERYRITQHESRAQADAAAAPGRISCIKADFTL